MSPTEKTLQTQIDDNLRRIFDEDAQTELPDRLLKLLERLDEVPAPGKGLSDDAGTDGEPA
ncbi:NepR family anti-sigma factor [Tropicimonas sp. IMCC6043]|uniref:NepR family anti-sigma factor n=1 Tax=Tropicimonas sp. IMCC6043 TaxID=2510645 RepID=UPI00101DB847|nr:NepR family anti-sigma factor [Tropicimonas sp. IMCC6043]RYH06555.1 hypothetical protein EU800_23505 [Tropicimonas sp. IMCC6043]